jgi:hypothetical protein
MKSSADEEAFQYLVSDLPEFQTSDFNDRVALTNPKSAQRRGVDPAHVSFGSLCQGDFTIGMLYNT